MYLYVDRGLAYDGTMASRGSGRPATAASTDLESKVARGVQALSDPTRVRIVALILGSDGGRAFVSSLAAQLGLSQPTITHHLARLVTEGILTREFVGRRAWYSISADRLDEVGRLLADHAGSTAVPPGVLARITRDLAERYRGTFSRQTVAKYVRESHELLALDGRMTRLLPSSTARFAADRLAALARAKGATSGVPEVLFVCVKNAGRSQLAASILRSLAGDTVRVRSAGSDPAGTVNPLVVAALDEIGVPLDGEFPKPLTDEVVRAADYVITMGCGDACPIYPGREYLDWDLPDPVGLSMDGVRAVRDEIDGRVRELLAALALREA